MRHNGSIEAGKGKRETRCRLASPASFTSPTPQTWPFGCAREGRIVSFGIALHSTSPATPTDGLDSLA
jgi:hypothetical protein